MRVEDIIADYEKILEIVTNRLRELKSQVPNRIIQTDIKSEFDQKRQEILNRVNEIKQTVDTQLKQMGKK